MNKSNLILGGVVAILLLLIGGTGGWLGHKEFKPCPKITTDTVTIHDTITYTVYDSIPILKVDTVKLPGDSIPYPRVIDTAAILRNYFTVLDYTWSKQDSNLSWDLVTRVTQNRPISYNFKYNILRPQTVVINNTDNSVNYTKYIYGGLSIPLSTTRANEFAVEGFYAFTKGYIGVGYQPYINTLSLKAGIKIFKFETKK